jgi:hypothetical protein
MTIVYENTSSVLDDTNRIDKLFNNLDETHVNIQKRRENLLAKLEHIIDSKNFIPDDLDMSANHILARVAIINSFKDTLKEAEDSDVKIINSHLKKRELQSNAETSKDVVDFLQRLHKQQSAAPDTRVDLNTVEATINEALRKRDINIHPNELRDNAYDFSEAPSITFQPGIILDPKK